MKLRTPETAEKLRKPKEPEKSDSTVGAFEKNSGKPDMNNITSVMDILKEEKVKESGVANEKVQQKDEKTSQEAQDREQSISRIQQVQEVVDEHMKEVETEQQLENTDERVKDLSKSEGSRSSPKETPRLSSELFKIDDTPSSTIVPASQDPYRKKELTDDQDPSTSFPLPPKDSSKKRRRSSSSEEPLIKVSIPTRHADATENSPPPVLRSINFDELDDTNEQLIELRGEGRYFGFADDNLGGPICRNCHKRGHIASKCTVVVCEKCGAIDTHTTRDCPKSQRCSNCGQIGHLRSACREKSIRIFCTRCSARSHLDDTCPLIWRQYTRSKDADLIHYPTNVSCYNCGGSSHYGDDCPEPRAVELRYKHDTAFNGSNLPLQLQEKYSESKDRNTNSQRDRTGLASRFDFNNGRKVEFQKSSSNFNFRDSSRERSRNSYASAPNGPRSYRDSRKGISRNDRQPQPRYDRQPRYDSRNRRR